MTLVESGSGLALPLLGLGTWGLHGSELGVALRAALAAGCGLLDTSSAYGNEAGIGQVLRDSSNAGNVVIESKVGPRHMGYHKAREAAATSIARMGRLDVLLIHWPGRNRRTRAETWRALEELYQEGKVRAIGVSNFLPEHIVGLLEDGAKVKPVLNQFELHPLCQARQIVAYCCSEGICVQSYSPLGGGPAQGSIRREHGTRILLGHPVVQAISQETGRSAAAVCLRWAVQQGFAVVPKSRVPEHIHEHAVVFDFELSQSQMDRLAAMDEDHHFAWDPRTTL